MRRVSFVLVMLLSLFLAACSSPAGVATAPTIEPAQAAPATATKVPSATPVPPAPTLAPTDTPVPTDTPAPTDSPVPTKDPQ
jgi:PBP1b-binding outer membrane lipoprotein LpoB